jgi:tripartite-type tricarboxylate transporter receptor subunit TctC
MEKRNFLKGLLIFGMVLVLIMIGDSASFAQREYPNREIEMVIPMAAGGMVDITTRLVNEELSKNLGVQVVVVNKPGASGSIGAHYAAKAKPDGYTILGASQSNFVLLPILMENLPYKPSDFVPIARTISTPLLFVVRKDAPWNTLEQLVDYAKKNPGKLTCATTGVGTSAHFVLEMLKLEAGIEIQHVPFKGGGEQNAALMGGHVDLNSTTLNPVLPLLKSGDMRALVTPNKMKEFPEVPTLSEKGYPGVALTSWVGYAGPKGIEKSVVDKIAAALEKAVKIPKVIKNLEETGSHVDFVAKEEFVREMEMETKRLAAVVKKANIIMK